MNEVVTQGNSRVEFRDPDEPIEGFKKKTWVPPAEWGPGQFMGEGQLHPRSPRPIGNERFLSGIGTASTSGGLHQLAVPYVSIYFKKVDKWVKRLVRPCHGYDAPIPSHQQPEFNHDDLCP
jgi:hypothetical protein